MESQNILLANNTVHVLYMWLIGMCEVENSLISYMYMY